MVITRNRDWIDKLNEKGGKAIKSNEMVIKSEFLRLWTLIDLNQIGKGKKKKSIL